MNRHEGADAVTTLFEHATIYTGDPVRPWASSLAVRDGVIIAVDARPPGRFAVQDLGGAFVMPGFVDAHNHHAIAGLAELYEFTIPLDADLTGVLALVEAQARDSETGAWVVGNGWSPLLLGELATSSSRSALDAATHGRPTMLRDQSRHNRWVNTAALVAAGAPGTPPNAGIGDASGLLVETAGLDVERALAHARATSARTWASAASHAIAILNGYGVTAFQDAGASLPLMRALHDLDRRGELSAWVVSCAVINDTVIGIDPAGRELIQAARETASTHHRPTFAKIFLDGIPPMRTAAFLAPYCADGTHPAGHRGEPAMSQDELTGWLLELGRAGLSVKVHCTGDAAVRAVLDAVEVVRRSTRTQSRFQVAHGQYVDPGDVPRFAELGVIAEISPFVWYPGVIPDALATVLPAERAGHVHPNRDLLDSGVLVAAGSDWPVSESPDPLQGLYGLVTRADPTGRHPGTLWPEQALTLPEAIGVCTRNGAEAAGLDDVTGVLVSGRSADFVVLDGDPFRAPIGELSQRRVVQTWFEGSLVYER